MKMCWYYDVSTNFIFDKVLVLYKTDIEAYSKSVDYSNLWKKQTNLMFTVV